MICGVNCCTDFVMQRHILLLSDKCLTWCQNCVMHRCEFMVADKTNELNTTLVTHITHHIRTYSVM